MHMDLNYEKNFTWAEAYKKGYNEGQRDEREYIEKVIRRIELEVVRGYSDFAIKPEVVEFYKDAVEATKQAILSAIKQ